MGVTPPLAPYREQGLCQLWCALFRTQAPPPNNTCICCHALLKMLTLHGKSGLVLVAAGALLLISAVALGQTTTSPIPTRPVPPTQSPAPCSELAEYSDTYRNCDIYSNCSGTLCHLMQQLTGSTAKFWVEEKCADPIMVDLNVDGPESSHLNGYRGQFRVGGDGLHVREPNSITADYGRNASHLNFQAMTFIDGDQALRLIPEITVPLNPRQCMCQSMRQIASIIQSNHIPVFNIGLRCSARPDCAGVFCNITFGDIGNYVADISIDPCGETVHMVVVDSSNATQADRMFNDSGTYSFTPPGAPSQTQATLNIGMVHHNYSMDVSVSLQLPFVPIPDSILPRQKIILDRSHCTNLTYYYENSASTTTSVPPVTTGGVHPATTGSPPPSNCLQTNAQNCQITGNSCSGISCTARLSGSPVVASAEVLERCADPVMVNMSVSPSYQQSFSVPGDGLGSQENINRESVRVEYGRNASHLHFKAIGLIPEVHIPLYPRPCMCQSMVNLSNSIQAGNLSLIFRAATSCSKHPNCDGVRCVAAGSYTSDIIIDPCQESVRIVLRSTSNSVVFNETFSQSAEHPVHIPIGQSGLTPKLYVGIVHYNFSMQLSMKVNTDGVDPLTLFSPQRIILDRTNCVDITYYRKNPEVTTQRPASPSPGGHGGGSQPSASPPNNGDKHSAPLALVVGVPFGILLVLAAGLLIAITTVLILWRLRKQRRAYAFQRMTFSEVDDDDEKD